MNLFGGGGKKGLIQILKEVISKKLECMMPLVLKTKFDILHKYGVTAALPSPHG